MTVMIVDDAVTTRMAIGNILTEMGYQNIVTAENALEALVLANDITDLELLFVDWNMPYMTGLELIHTLRTRPIFQSTKILMVTTETGILKIVEALKAGANEYIMKPFTKEMLIDKLKILGLLK